MLDGSLSRATYCNTFRFLVITGCNFLEVALANSYDVCMHYGLAVLGPDSDFYDVNLASYFYVSIFSFLAVSSHIADMQKVPPRLQ